MLAFKKQVFYYIFTTHATRAPLVGSNRGSKKANAQFANKPNEVCANAQFLGTRLVWREAFAHAPRQ